MKLYQFFKCILVFITLLYFGSCGDSFSAEDSYITIRNVEDLELAKEKVKRTSKLNYIGISFEEETYIDLAFLNIVKEVHEVYLKNVKFPEQTFSGLEKVNRMEIKGATNDTIVFSSLDTIVEIFRYEIKKEEGAISCLEMPRLRKVGRLFEVIDYYKFDKSSLVSLSMPSITKAFRINFDLPYSNETFVDLKGLNEVGSLTLKSLTINNDAFSNVKVTKSLRLSISSGIMDLNWLKPSLGVNSTYRIVGFKAKDLCVLKPVADSEPLRIKFNYQGTWNTGELISKNCE